MHFDKQNATGHKVEGPVLTFFESEDNWKRWSADEETRQEGGRVLSRPERWFLVPLIVWPILGCILLKTIAIPSSSMGASPKSSAILLEPLQWLLFNYWNLWIQWIVRPTVGHNWKPSPLHQVQGMSLHGFYHGAGLGASPYQLQSRCSPIASVRVIGRPPSCWWRRYWRWCQFSINRDK